ncbi:UNVERIFIED_CONTAM: hypothetical protein FKN15_074900 [Acipenser sinensis]
MRCCWFLLSKGADVNDYGNARSNPFFIWFQKEECSLFSGAVDSCPRSLDCTMQRRQFCQPGSRECGSCISPLVEDEHKNCVVMKRSLHAVAAHSPRPATAADEVLQCASTSSAVSIDLTAAGKESRKLSGQVLFPECLCALVMVCASSPVHHRQRLFQYRTGKISTVPSVDEEIDYLASIIAKQRHQQVELKQEDNPPTVIGNALETSRKEEIPVQMNADVQSATGEAKASQSPTTAANTPTKPAVWHGPVTSPYPGNDALLLTMIVVCTVVGTAALIVAGMCWVRLQKEMRLAQKVDYPAFRVMGPTTFEGTSPGDKKLAQSAQMYHYQHQKQQMLSMEKHKEEPKEPGSGATSDEENEDGDFTVYECPGLAPKPEDWTLSQAGRLDPLAGRETGPSRRQGDWTLSQAGRLDPLAGRETGPSRRQGDWTLSQAGRLDPLAGRETGPSRRQGDWTLSQAGRLDPLAGRETGPSHCPYKSSLD